MEPVRAEGVVVVAWVPAGVVVVAWGSVGLKAAVEAVTETEAEKAP